MQEIFNRRSYLSWIAVCALSPILQTVRDTALDFSPESAYAWLFRAMGLGVAALAVLTPPIWQWLVLRTVAPRLSWSIWYLIAAFCMALNIGAQIFLPVWFHWNPDHTTQVTAELLTQYAETPAPLLDIIKTLPWPDIAGYLATETLSLILLPAVILGRDSSLPWRHFLIAGVAGICALHVANNIASFATDSSPLARLALNGWSWNYAAIVVAQRALLGAIEGATACVTLALLARRKDSNIPVRLPATLLTGIVLAMAAFLTFRVIMFPSLHESVDTCDARGFMPTSTSVVSTLSYQALPRSA